MSQQVETILAQHSNITKRVLNYKQNMIGIVHELEQNFRNLGMLSVAGY